MHQVNAIRNKLLHERHFNNFENRVEFVNLSQSIFANLIDIVDSGLMNQERVRVNAFGDNLDVDSLSNMSSSQNIADTTVSTYHIPIHAPQQLPHATTRSYPNPLSPLARNWGRDSGNTTQTHYEKLPSEIQDDSTIALDFGDVETSTRKDYWGKANVVPVPPVQKFEYVPIEGDRKRVARNRIKEQRLLRRNKMLLKLCKNMCIGISIAGVLLIITFVGIKFFF